MFLIESANKHGTSVSEMTRHMGIGSLLSVVIMLGSSVAFGVEYTCPISQKWDLGTAYSEDQLREMRASVRIVETSDGASLHRCSYSLSQREVTCDEYEVDRVEFDHNVGVKKYYVFRSQFDVQLFSSLTMIENNGRGGIAIGECSVTSP